MGVGNKIHDSKLLNDEQFEHQDLNCLTELHESTIVQHFKIKLKIWDKAKREYTRRCKSVWLWENFRGAGLKSPSLQSHVA